ncbi:MAG TPA: hypothetical protein VNZ64_11165 [Candidatus Acidoferrum sp.]|jgi:hypothetical protein|nr:hypothetical protein [Candidatus Acidoferrum sp.]
MKLVRASAKRFWFQFRKREMDRLKTVLKFYPCIPSAYQRLTKSTGLPDAEASQKLLDEALADQRAENKKRLAVFLAAPGRLAANAAGFQLSLSPGELEWLLQVLNDIRVGSWVILGSPEHRIESVNERTAPHIWAMEVAGSFQMGFLEEVEGRRAAGEG